MSNIFTMNRRHFLKTGATFLGAGLLQPVLPLIGAGKDVSAAYPDEILSIEKYSHGKVKPGDIISKDNADLVKDFAPEGLYTELIHGREIKIAEANLKPQALVPVPWVDATFKNQGQAILDAKVSSGPKADSHGLVAIRFPKPRLRSKRCGITSSTTSDSMIPSRSPRR
jgi:hypothetical protein